jgi:hypothetical protein
MWQALDPAVYELARLHEDSGKDYLKLKPHIMHNSGLDS